MLNATRPDRKTERKLTGAKRLARQYEHLWPDKPGQSKEQKIDSLRHSLTDHIPHIGEKIEKVREEEKEHVKTLSDYTQEIIDLCLSNVKKATLAAESKGKLEKDPVTKKQRAVGWEPRDFRDANQSAMPICVLLSRLSTPKENPAEQESDDFIDALKGTAKDDWKDTGPIQVETSESKAEDDI